MKKTSIILSIPFVLIALFACTQEKRLQALNLATVTDISYAHTLSPGTTIRCRKNSPMLEVVKIVAMRDVLGSETIIVGDNSRIYYVGSANGLIMFRLAQDVESLEADPDLGDFLTFSEDRHYIDLWGIEFEVLHVTADQITCRLMPRTTKI